MIKSILITGSTDGIGKLTALKLAKDGHTIYLHGRNKDKLNASIEEIKEKSKNGSISGFVTDFSDLKAVKQMAGQIVKEVPQLDVLINNAGVYNSTNSQNKEGLDMRIVVNYLSPYVLTNTLLSSLQKSGQPRVLNLSSAAQASVNLDTLAGKVSISERDGYAQSKLAVTMWSFHLAKTKPGLTVIAVNPGSLLNTKMVKEAFGQHWSPADKGADILVALATSDKYKDVTGKYFDNDQGDFAQAHGDAYDEAKLNELIKETDEILTKK